MPSNSSEATERPAVIHVAAVAQALVRAMHRRHPLFLREQLNLRHRVFHKEAIGIVCLFFESRQVFRDLSQCRCWRVWALSTSRLHLYKWLNNHQIGWFKILHKTVPFCESGGVYCSEKPGSQRAERDDRERTHEERALHMHDTIVRIWRRNGENEARGTEKWSDLGCLTKGDTPETECSACA